MSCGIRAVEIQRLFVIRKLKEKLLVSRSEPTYLSYKVDSFFSFYSL